ncbi:MAG: DUF4422 domain-containing protein [Olsenella sp.]|nr:DUF4422 domain-containing protein [Olsenella sp.]
MANADIKIFVSCHKDGVYFPENSLLYPIQVGCAGKKHLPGMLHDDDGENISEKNPSYCELTAQYWAWKNADADYFGFMHYRRYFSFAPETKLTTNYFGDALLHMNDAKTLKKLGYDEATMRNIIERYDFIVPEKGSFVNGMTMREQYLDSWQHHEEDLDCVLDILHEKYPEFDDVAAKYLNSKEGYFCNMFIMKKEIFHAYSAWLFDILGEHERRRGKAMENYDIASYRVSGYLAERLCGIYLTWLEEQNKYRWTTLQRALFDDVSTSTKLQPVFDDNAVCVAFSANDFYAPYLSTLLQSIKDHASPDRNYDLIVLHEDISKRNQTVLKQQIEAPNISLRFLHMYRAMHDFQDNLPIRGHFKVETYFRLLLPQLLPQYDKILYLDSDMVVMQDIAPLYDTDVNGYLIAACQDPDTAGLYNGASDSKKEYMDKELKIRKPYDYIQAGTIVFNLDAWRKTYDPQLVFEFAMSNEWQLLDQDVINYLCQDKIRYVDMSWNVMMDWRDIRINQIIARAPRQIYFAYMEARKHPYVIHYAGPDKPWLNPLSDFALEFWQYARQTPYYEEMMARLSTDRALHTKPDVPVEKAKKFVYRGIITPMVQKAHPTKDKGFEKMRYIYRTIHPRKKDIL